MRKNHIDIVSFGCSKNLIDTERLIRRLEAKGYTVTADPVDVSGEYVMVNTCGFIGDAKEESIDFILAMGEYKAEGKIGNLCVMGCLSERYRNTLQEEIPEIDRLYGKFDWDGFVDSLPDLKVRTHVAEWERTLTTPPHTAYVKISEGCNRFCAFCAIPLITGRHKSRKIEEILEEVKDLAAGGVKEFNILAQDLSSYGLDIYKEHKLAELIDKMADIEGVKWIRLHYAYPADFPEDVLDVMARRDNVCKYIDIALQHISDNMLSRMRRRINKKDTLNLLDRIHAKVPDIKIRTTLMVGFPGETEEDFEELMEFVKEQKFDRMGCFEYSEEEDTFAANNYEDDVPADVKHRRRDMIMNLQEEISATHNREDIGKRVVLLVDETETDDPECRSQWDSPGVDQTYYLDAGDEDVYPGDFVEAIVTGANEFDLFARLERKINE
ncbi:MAG: 30S ribosomal protein S12 methylthiotransferase RimO [Candidatus Amulumruptor caecigallinarius]|nr:30S ribosomal protein S12 methylthiotransferase RimO [Candidatus Amulumruptor caecigallinarius]